MKFVEAKLSCCSIRAILHHISAGGTGWGQLKESYEVNTTIYRYRDNSAVIRLLFRENIITP